MTATPLESWLDRLGYADEPTHLHRHVDAVPESHAYAREIKALLHPDGDIRAKAVFDVEGVPSVAFLTDENGQRLSSETLDAVRMRVWNQNLVNIVIDVCGSEARITPARKLRDAAQILDLSNARADGEFSALDVASANLARRFPDWFDIKARVDSQLLSNLSEAVSQLAESGFDGRAGGARQRQRAELLMGQVLFLSYLEHRDIVGETYRKKRQVSRLHDLVSQSDRDGVRRLIDCLQDDFNGDFLSDDRHDPWAVLNTSGFELINRFLRRTDMRSGQTDFWNYDFSFIPVELLSGLYESFLSPDEQARTGAYYTPRHLAMLAVDQALASSKNPLAETIFDGACGSGILLTTVYRRLITLQESRVQRQLGLKERRDLLVRQIFGADINQMACRVTAFSLYLSLLEGLNPADIMEAQRLGRARLPNLAGRNLLYGDAADFFGQNHGFVKRRFSLFICNPPWGEPAGPTVTTADKWIETSHAPVALRQIAGAFAFRALDFLNDGGRVCLILPIAMFLGPTNARFIAGLFRRIRPERLINFGDLQDLLFPTAEHTCHVLLGSRRSSETSKNFGETFDYCVPKADMSLAYGRLTMQSADRHQLQTSSVIDDPQILVTLMWGDLFDLELIGRLSSYGTLGDLCGSSRNKARFVARKGIHTTDRSREPVSATPLQRIPFVPVEALSAGAPVLNSALLTNWPSKYKTVVGLDEPVRSVFKGPRVLFSDGFSREDLSIRAVYYEAPASFTVSLGVIAGTTADAPLLKFLAAYLRSNLARYLMMMRAWKMLCERNAIHLADIENFPFFLFSSAPNPERAKKAFERVYARMDKLAALDEFRQAQAYADQREAFDNDIFDYFDLSVEERSLITEAVEILLPSIRPRSYTSLNTMAQRPAGRDDITRYARALGNSLTNWRKRTGGRGQFSVGVVWNDPESAGTTGIVKVTYNRETTAAAKTETAIDDQLALSTLRQVRSSGLSVIPSGHALNLVPDVHIWTKDAFYLVRPLTRRSWMLRQAWQDAEQIVREVQTKLRYSREADVA